MNLKNNVKLYSLILLLAFLTAQVSLALHTVEHGVLEHTHAGKQCEQCLFDKQYNADAPSSLLVNVDFKEYDFSYYVASSLLNATYKQALNQPRAPPFYS